MNPINSFSSSLLIFHQFLTNDSNSISNEIKNAYKMNRLILDVLTPSLQNWIESNTIWYNIHHSNNPQQDDIRKEIKNHFDQNKEYNSFSFSKTSQEELMSHDESNKIWDDIKNSKDKNLKDVKNNNPDNLIKNFDVSACYAILRNVFKFEPRHGWLNDYDQIKLNNMKIADAFNYSRIIRNKFYGHTAKFEINQADFNDLLTKLDKILEKIETSNEIKILKENILQNDIKIENKAEEFRKWQEEATKVLDKSNQYFINIQQIEPGNKYFDTKNITLYTLYIQQSLNETNKKYLCFNIKQFIDDINNSKIQDFLRSDLGKDYQVILIYCFDDKSSNEDLKSLISNKQLTQSIIVVGIDKIDSFESLSIEKLNFNHLNEETKRNFLSKNISFEKQDIAIYKLIGVDISQDLNNLSNEILNIFKNIDDNILDNLFNRKLFKILDKKSLGFEEIKDYYIERTFQRFIYFDKQILNDEKLKDKNHFVFDQDDFNKTNIQNKSIHLFEKTDSYLKWIKTKGNLKDLENYLIKSKPTQFEEDELKIDLINDNQKGLSIDKIMIICDEPGMGKTTTTKKLAQELINNYNRTKSNENNYPCFIIYLSLSNFDLAETNDIMEMICNNLDEENKDLIFSFYQLFAKSNRLVIIFDGLDEANDNINQLIEIIYQGNINYDLRKMIITSRSHLRKELENTFGSITYNLTKLSKQNQIKFLQKYWCKHSEVKDDKQLENFAQNLIDRIENVLFKRSDFVEIPLQIRMLADIYKNGLEQITKKERIDSSRIFKELKNMYNFYERFFYSKLSEYISKHYESKNQRERFKKSIEKEFWSKHYYYSLKLLFNYEIFKKNYLNEDKEVIEFGIITEIDEKSFKFMHQSYAEFLTAKYLVEENDEKINIMCEIMVQQNYFLIRKLIENYLMNKIENNINIEKSLEDIISRQDQDNNFKILINGCAEGNINITKILISNEIDINQTDTDGKNALHYASEEGHKDIVELLVSNGIDINQENDYGRNALHFASEEGHRDIVELLISKGIDINLADGDGLNALHYASKNGNIDIMEFLISKGIDINQTDGDGKNALHYASRNGNIDIVKLLITKGIDINQMNNDRKNALHFASEEGHRDIVELLISKGIDINQTDGDGLNALHYASRNGNIDYVEFLISQGIDINQTDGDGINALHYASHNGHKYIVELLISKGVDINLTDINGTNALHYASLNGNKDIMELLISKGIDINQKDKDGTNALHYASRNGNKDIIELLISKGIDINQTDNYGKNAWNIASRNGNIDIVELLISKGIDINQNDNDGTNALHYASRNGNKDIMELLISKGIDINQTDNYGKNAWNIASEYGHKDIVELLISKGINIAYSLS